MSREELIYSVEKFIDQNDISIKNAQRIEVLLDDLNSEEEIIENMILILASYVSGGSEYLYDEDEVISELKKILIFLNDV
ncbi:hypothetical protein [Acinetobacter sp. Tr-809]|uniref:hypothetical protein n=1 Tax=Acinetobacter sp. Tr-809 TaxID=2608324 RepID=UPI00142080A5|nr:hypothetical protein [Acinetobacter sp. Tr-809]